MDWTNRLQEIQRVNNDLQNFASGMTNYEFHVVSQDRLNKINANRTVIENGIKSEVLKAVQDHADARRWLKSSEQTEVNSWDLEKLNAAYAVTKVMFDFAVNSDNPASKVRTLDKIGNLWDEVKLSNDKYKIRAFNDLITGTQAKMTDRDEARKMNKYIVESNNAIESIRITPQMERFAQDVQDTYNLASQKIGSLREVIQALGDQSTLGDFERSIDRFIDPDDNLPHVKFVESEHEKHRYIMP